MVVRHEEDQGQLARAWGAGSVYFVLLARILATRLLVACEDERGGGCAGCSTSSTPMQFPRLFSANLLTNLSLAEVGPLQALSLKAINRPTPCRSPIGHVNANSIKPLKKK